ncbi:aldehyde dehydrogenase family protein [Mesorhizobium sp. 1M-11]|uniref:aldehyde dehydrogenase family protein n=1 Tax=Mesorhizobium sp. 1M-11 TaxID=1529006 RepID=UPI001FCDB7AD|nr:aldehyde dehydrogenase family protein [Mesorhizobium sp. 1M-11]
MSACVCTRDLATAHRAISRIHSGKVEVNANPFHIPPSRRGRKRRGLREAS